MNNFNFKNFVNKVFGSVRTIVDSSTDEIWFLANDVANALGYQASRNAIAVHTAPDDRKTLKYKACTKSVRAKLWGPNDFMDKVFINESGLYCLIFGSKMEKAIEFKSWITKTVIPSIRQNGGYILGQENLSPSAREALSQEIQSLSAKVSYLKERRHTLIVQNKASEAKRKELKKTVKSLNAYATNMEDMYFKVLDEYEVLSQMTRAARRTAIPVTVDENIPSFSYTVDKYGMVNILAERR